MGTSGDGLGGSGEQERELRGYIDEVFLYDRVLTQEEIGIWAERSPPSDLLGEYYWYPWTNGETLPYWVTEPSADEIHLFAESEAQSNSGVNMDFGSPLKTLDLSGYDELVFDAEVAEGTPFVVAVGLDMVVGSWCSWNLVGRGLATYQVPLGSPDYCTTCTFDLRFVSGLDFSTDWRTAASLDLRLTRISFETTTGGAGTARPDELTPGVLDLCWGLYAWGEGDEPASSQWTQAPDATQVSVQATGSESGEAGMLSRLEPDPTDLTPYGYIEFEATVTQGVPFRVSLGTAAAERCAYELDGRGADTHLVDRTQPSGCWDETGTEITDFDFRQVNTIDFGTVWGTVGVVDISVTGFRFLSSDSSL